MITAARCRSLPPLTPLASALRPACCSETYQYFNLPFCHPKEGKEYKPEGLGEVLEGDRLVSTPYKLKCAVLVVGEAGAGVGRACQGSAGQLWCRRAAAAVQPWRQQQQLGGGAGLW